MRQIEERITVIAPGAIVRMKKEVAGSIKDLLARWRVLGSDDELIRVEDVEDPEDTRTFNLEQIERVSGGVEVIDDVLRPASQVGGFYCPEHNEWPACIRYEKNILTNPLRDFEPDNGSLFDDFESFFDDVAEEDES